MMDEELTPERIEEIMRESAEKDRAVNALKTSKLKQIPVEMLKQIEQETQMFDIVEAPTQKQKYEQACRLAMLLSRQNCFVIDFKMDINTVETITDNGSTTTKTGTLEMWCDTVTLFFSRELFFWNKLNSLADHLRIVYSKDGFDGRPVIKFVYLIYNIEE